MKLKINVIVAAGLLSLGLGTAFADQNHSQHGGTKVTAAATTGAMTAGEVRKVDAEQGKVTLKHEPITNLDMPAMTMVFRVATADILKDLKVGDKISFHAESANGAIVVTHIQAQK